MPTVLIGIARMVDSATKHLVSRVRQSLDVHKNKRIHQKMEWIRGEHMKTIWKRTVQSTISGNMLTWTVLEEFGNMINISPCQDGGGRYQAPREATVFCMQFTSFLLFQPFSKPIVRDCLAFSKGRWAQTWERWQSHPQFLQWKHSNICKARNCSNVW